MTMREGKLPEYCLSRKLLGYSAFPQWPCGVGIQKEFWSRSDRHRAISGDTGDCIWIVDWQESTGRKCRKIRQIFAKSNQF